MSQYATQYEIWHGNTESSIKKDIETWKNVLSLHKLLPESSTARILDVGCASGRLLMTLKDLGFTELYGIEKDHDLATEASKYLDNISEGDAFQIVSTMPEKFDVIFFFDCLEHIEREKQIPLLRKLKELLTDNGYIVVQVPNAASPVSSIMLYQDATHHCLFTEESLRYVLYNAGFEQINIREHDAPFNHQVATVRSFWNAVYQAEFGERKILSLNIVAVAYIHENPSNTILPTYFNNTFETLSAESILEMLNTKCCSKELQPLEGIAAEEWRDRAINLSNSRWRKLGLKLGLVKKSGWGSEL